MSLKIILNIKASTKKMKKEYVLFIEKKFHVKP